MNDEDADRSLPPKPLRVLFIEDNKRDALLLDATLESAGFDVVSERVDTLGLFQQRLAQTEPEIIVCDYNLPGWTALDALESLKNAGKDIPFIVVTGSLSDEVAVDVLKHGATDYIVKDRLARLPEAIRRALDDRALREERRQAGLALGKSNKMFEELFENAPSAVILINGQGEIARVNLGMEDLFGYRREELLGQSIEMLVPESFREAHTRHRMAYAAKPSVRKVRHGVSLFGRRKDGTVFPADILLSPVKTEDGLLVLAFVIDTTERQRAETSLKESEERFRQVAETITEVFWIRDAQMSKILYVSPGYERVWGRSTASLYEDPRSFLESIHAEDRERVLGVLDAQKAGQPFDHEYRIRRADGSMRWIWDRGFPVRIEKGQVTRYVGVAQDITERKHLESQFLQSQKIEAVGRLAGGVAHDFNNLLTVINGLSFLILERSDIIDPVRKHVKEILKAGERAASLTHQLLAFSRKQVMEPRVLDLNAVLENMDKMLRRLIGEDIDLVTIPGQGLGQVKADPTQIEQVIMNLAINARDAMPRGGKLTIETKNVELDGSYASMRVDVKPGQYVMLAISDSGHGMDAETLAHVFEPFFTTKGPGKGTGLGLSTVYGIVKQTGGYVSVYSEVGKGTTIKVYLPRLDSPVEPEGVGAERGDVVSGQETILVVEDEAGVRTLIQNALEPHGYTTLLAGTPAEAVILSEKYAGRIDLLLTDVVMPGFGGKELADRLAMSRPEMKVLFISGYTGDAIAHQGVLDAETAFLQKPFTPNILLRKIRETITKGKP